MVSVVPSSRFVVGSSSGTSPVQRDQPRFAAALTAILVAVVCAITTSAVVAVSRARTNDQRVAEEQQAEESVTALEDRMAAYSEMLYGVRSVAASGTASFTDFHDAVTALDVGERLPGVQTIGLATVVESSTLPTWVEQVGEQAAAADLAYPTLQVRPDPGPEDALVVERIVPVAGNEAAFGFDFFSEFNRRNAALRARDSGLPAATAPVRLVQETGSQQAFLLMLPIYESGAPTATQADRRSAFTGVAYAAFRVDDLIEGVYGGRQQQVVEIVDTVTGQSMVGETVEPGGSIRTERVVIGGRTWDVTFALPSAAGSIAGWVPLFLGIGGASVLILLLVLRQMLVRSRRRTVQLAEDMVEELEALVEAASEAIVTIDADGMILTWNRGAGEIFGGESAEMLGTPLENLVPPSGREAMREAITQIVDGSLTTRTFRATACRVDGERFPAELSVSRWESRGEVFVTGFVRDHTELERAKAEHEETARLLSAVLEAATEVSVIATDTSGTIRVFNRGAERMLGYSARDVVGKVTPEILHDPKEVADRARELGIEAGFEVFVQEARAGRAETRTWTYVRADGGRVPVELTVMPMFDRNAVAVGSIGVAVDITDRIARDMAQHAALERERALVDELKRQAQAKSDFMSSISHELRTPLTSVRGAAELLDDHLSDDDSATSLVEVIDRNVDRVLGLVDDLLTLARMEAHVLLLKTEPCSISAMVDDVMTDIDPIARRRGITLTTEIGELPVLDADRAQLERALLNVLSNAIKFSPDGGLVHVRADADGETVEITVEDHGIGIPEDEQEKLFTRFFRSSSAEMSAIGGTGLGLAIVAGIVELHGGSASVVSAADRGTTVVLRLPMNQPALAAPEREVVS